MTTLYTPDAERSLRLAITRGLDKDREGFMRAMGSMASKPTDAFLAAVVAGALMMRALSGKPDHLQVYGIVGLAKNESQWLGYDIEIVLAPTILFGTGQAPAEPALVGGSDGMLLAAVLLMVTLLRTVDSERDQATLLYQVFDAIRRTERPEAIGSTTTVAVGRP